MKRLIRTALAVVALAAPVAHAETKPAAPAKAAPAKAAEVQKLTFTNKLEGDKKVWEPAEAKIKAGEKVEITLVNTLADPHGFQIPGLVDPVVVGGKETKTVTVAAPKAGSYKFSCQMHPAHVGGTLTVQ